MNFLHLKTSASTSSLHSSEQYSSAMVTGWVDGLKLSGKAGVVDVEFEVLFSKQRFALLRQDAGDIDLLMRFGADDLVLENLLPEKGYRISPDIAKTWIFKGLMCEAKRTCGSRNVKSHIGQLIKFYTGLLKVDSTYQPQRPISSDFQVLIHDTDTPIVFLFNGVDSVDAWNCFCEKLPTGEICGHKVCFLYCMSDQLTTWDETLRLKMMFEEERRQKEEERRQKEEEMRQKEEERRQKEEERRLKEEALLEVERLKKMYEEGI